MKRFKGCLVLVLTSCLMACSNNGDATKEQQVVDEASETQAVEDSSSQETSQTKETTNKLENSVDTNSDVKSNDVQSNDVQSNDAQSNDTANSESDNQIAEKTKDYILNGQDDLPEAGKLNWSETFLAQVDINSVYQEYLAGGGKSADIEGFAKYLTLNAPISDNWEELFKSDFAKAYGEKVTRIEKLEDDFYQVYVELEGAEVPYVVVNARTGYYHG